MVLVIDPLAVQVDLADDSAVLEQKKRGKKMIFTVPRGPADRLKRMEKEAKGS